MQLLTDYIVVGTGGPPGGGVVGVPGGIGGPAGGGAIEGAAGGGGIAFAVLVCPVHPLSISIEITATQRINIILALIFPPPCKIILLYFY